MEDHARRRGYSAAPFALGETFSILAGGNIVLSDVLM